MILATEEGNVKWGSHRKAIAVCVPRDLQVWIVLVVSSEEAL